MMKLGPGAWRARPKDASPMMMNCITIVYQVSSNDAFSSRKIRHYFSTFTKEYLDITLHQGAWSVKPFNKVFTGRQPLMTWFKL
jgi:hypothetical protein